MRLGLRPYVHPVVYVKIKAMDSHQSGTQKEKTAVCFVEWVHRRFPPHHLEMSGITQTDQRGLETKKGGKMTHKEMN